MASTNISFDTNEQTLNDSALGKAIGVSHLSWYFDAKSTKQLAGKVTSREIGPLKVSWIDMSLGLEHWSGARRAKELQASPEPYLTIVMPIKGAIALKGASDAVEIRQRELAIWDSTQELGFEINAPNYEQISVLVPQRMLRATADACAALHCAHLDENNVLSELCVQHMSTLAKFLNSQLRPYEMSLSSVTTSLIDSMIASLFKAPRDRELLVGDIKNYIECYITDDTLTPSTIAAAFEISTRYVHKLFEHDGHTIGEWILERRLSRSVDDLVLPESSITETAFRWGFKDLGHYSRTFKKRFDVSPSVYRKRAMGQT